MAQTEEERKAARRAYYQANKARIREREKVRKAGRKKQESAYWKAHYQAHKDDYAERQRRYRTRHPEKAAETRRRNQRTHQGILNATGEVREGPCPLCGELHKLVCDHWHDGPRKGQIRGWICRRCNFLLGHAKDSIEILDRAKAYLLADRPETS